jgi:hypothetical protein
MIINTNNNTTTALTLEGAATLSFVTNKGRNRPLPITITADRVSNFVGQLSEFFPKELVRIVGQYIVDFEVEDQIPEGTKLKELNIVIHRPDTQSILLAQVNQKGARVLCIKKELDEGRESKSYPPEESLRMIPFSLKTNEFDLYLEQQGGNKKGLLIHAQVVTIPNK